MATFDIVYDKSIDGSAYGFRKLLVVGADIFEYSSRKGKIESPSILRNSDAEVALKAINSFDYFYLPTYDANVQLISKASSKNKKFIINLSDITSRDGSDLSRVLYRISQFIKYCNSYNADYVFVSMARDKTSMRSSRESKLIQDYLTNQ